MERIYRKQQGNPVLDIAHSSHLDQNHSGKKYFGVWIKYFFMIDAQF